MNYSHLLLSRLAIVNTFGLFLAALAWYAGWFERIAEGDPSGISLLIVGLFLVGMYYVVSLARMIHELLEEYTTNSVERTEERLEAKLGVIAEIASSLVMIGMIGTVVGIIEAFALADPADLAASFPHVARGAGVALYTTLVGAVLQQWLRLNIRMLTTGCHKVLGKYK